MSQEQLDSLTPRQKELLELVAQGVTASKALTERTGLAPTSVDTYLSKATAILGTADRVDAAARYRELLESSRYPSRSRSLALDQRAEIGSSQPAGAARRFLGAVAKYLKGPPIVSGEREFSWHQVITRAVQAAVVGLVGLSVIVLLTLGFFATFGAIKVN